LKPPAGPSSRRRSPPLSAVLPCRVGLLPVGGDLGFLKSHFCLLPLGTHRRAQGVRFHSGPVGRRKVRETRVTPACSRLPIARSQHEHGNTERGTLSRGGLFRGDTCNAICNGVYVQRHRHLMVMRIKSTARNNHSWGCCGGGDWLIGGWLLCLE
jgi:hypothetical protein